MCTFVWLQGLANAVRSLILHGCFLWEVALYERTDINEAKRWKWQSLIIKCPKLGGDAVLANNSLHGATRWCAAVCDEWGMARRSCLKRRAMDQVYTPK